MGVGIDGKLWVASVSDFVSPSTVYRLNESGGVEVSFTTGIATNSFYFK
ncbi:MAG: hypothetical protein R2809_12985 [Flavobacteriales bacterium]